MQGGKEGSLFISGRRPLVYGEKEGLVICGRYLILTEEEVLEVRGIIQEISRRYADSPTYTKMKNGEIFPSDIVPAIALEDNQAQSYLFSWGFPSWKGSGIIINARSETVLEKPMFREAFVKRRCIIPANGFYEWKKEASKKKKDKYFLHLPNTPVLYMAGFYNVYEKYGTCLPGFVILTTAASPSVQAIHDRMPVIIEKHEQESWLNDQDFALHVIGRKGPQLETLPIAN